jgi:hypothetical protein
MGRIARGIVRDTLRRAGHLPDIHGRIFAAGVSLRRDDAAGQER